MSARDNLPARQYRGADLRLPSRPMPLNSKARRALDEQEAYELAVERVRHNVQMARAAYLGQLGRQAIVTTGSLSSLADSIGGRSASADARIQAQADMVAAGLLDMLGEAAR